jgi:hypothetical protein
MGGTPKAFPGASMARCFAWPIVTLAPPALTLAQPGRGIWLHFAWCLSGSKASTNQTACAAEYSPAEAGHKANSWPREAPKRMPTSVPQGLKPTARSLLSAGLKSSFPLLKQEAPTKNSWATSGGATEKQLGPTRWEPPHLCGGGALQRSGRKLWL